MTLLLDVCRQAGAFRQRQRHHISPIAPFPVPEWVIFLESSTRLLLARLTRRCYNPGEKVAVQPSLLGHSREGGSPVLEKSGF